ncbi:hypothetical protein L218DRAFT_1079627 [Marasmius fiardii PR-910]|nr:hypothetical protein L218DRAFT_1079627 [Marasmius fiardii PR-910]
MSYYRDHVYGQTPGRLPPKPTSTLSNDQKVFLPRIIQSRVRSYQKSGQKGSPCMKRPPMPQDRLPIGSKMKMYTPKARQRARQRAPPSGSLFNPQGPILFDTVLTPTNIDSNQCQYYVKKAARMATT